MTEKAQETAGRGKPWLNWQELVVRGIGLFLLVDIALALWVGKRPLPSMTWRDYLLAILDGATTWTTRLAWIFAFVSALVAVLYRRKAPQWRGPREVLTVVFRGAVRQLHKRAISVPLLVILVVLTPIFITLAFPSPPPLPPASTLLSTIDLETVQPRPEIYLALARQGLVLVFRADNVRAAADRVPIGNPVTPGEPLSIAVAPRVGVNGEVYIVDARSNSVIVLDRVTHARLQPISVGEAPRSIAITTDQRKAYVSNEQPIPQGTISVIDLKTHRVTKTITGVGCPEGLAMSPDGSQLYVATQCGGGHDPLFVIDTATDEVVASVPDLAVGKTVAVTPDGKKIYVASGGFDTRDPTGNITRVPDRLSVIAGKCTEGKRCILKTLPIIANVLAVTADSKYLIVGGERRMDVLDTAHEGLVSSIALGTSPAAVAVTKDGRVYAWLPDENRLYLQTLSGLLKQ